ncbi:MAG: NAD(P)H-quinone oxidoreductase subunit F, partial [Gloeomargaritaceae cyanobacterium C42_A2020_066]|nr:NAD(P)H-quinone oxidoreductase subunit F [Gloeomargaritaceae cyanobacterium C42_A2020_066]
LIALETVTGITLLAQVYALGYLEKDWGLARFYGLMGFFEAALSGIALSDSLFLSYALLEMLTLSTYLFVGFWYAQPLVVTAARDAFLTKRIGDVLLLMALVALSSAGASFAFDSLPAWAQTTHLPAWATALIGLGLMAGPVGKCAQFPLHLWLDEAMEGPSPASILRNSVVVAAGAYVLIQLQPVLSLSPVVTTALISLGLVTALGSSLMAIAQIDLKRTLSHSTSAYLGLVFIAVGLGQTQVALLLLFAHGLAKALLFMAAGAIMLTTTTQDLTEMGGLGTRMPATTLAFGVGAAGLVASLPLGLFWALDAWWQQTPSPPVGLLAVLLGVNALSALNLTRVFRLVFLGTPQVKTRRTPEVAWPMAVPMVAMLVINLVAPAIMIPWLNLDVSGRPAALGPLLLLASGLLGWGLGRSLALQRAWSRSTQANWRFIQDLLAYDFYMDRVYRVTVVQLVQVCSQITLWLDRHMVDGFVNLVGVSTLFSGQLLKYSITGQSQVYALTVVLGVLLLVAGWWWLGGWVNP